MRSCRLLLLVLLLPSAALAQAPRPQECKLHRIAAFPMTRVGNFVTVPVTVNGVETNFLVDTGGYVTSISLDTASAMNLTPHDIVFSRIQDAGAGGDWSGHTRAPVFRLSRTQALYFDGPGAVTAAGRQA